MNLPFKHNPLPWKFEWNSGEFCYWKVKDANDEDVDIGSSDYSTINLVRELINLLSDEQKKKLGQGMPNIVLEDSYHDEWWRFKDKSNGKEYTVKQGFYAVDSEKEAKELLESIIK